VAAGAPLLVGVIVRVVFLTGMMGSGKTEVGRALAARLGWRFIDTDAEIVAREGRSIGDIFASAGEAYFRSVEQAVLREASRQRSAVVATGGGAVTSAANRRIMRRAGPVVFLRAPVETLIDRIGEDADRPLLGADPRAALGRLYDQRKPLYEDASLIVEAARPIDEVVAETIARLAGSSRATVRVRLGARSYGVHIGAGILSFAGHDLTALGAGRRVLLASHGALMRRFGDSIAAALDGCGFTVYRVVVPAGERVKTLRRAAALYDACAAAEIGRDDTIMAVGGGVIGDLAGFVAGTYMRGVRLVQVPTTLLAQVDSSVGGKTAVNHPRAKNLIGVVWQPALVIADVDTLRSLPARERRAGLAEVVKYGMVLDAGLLDMLEGDDDQATVVARCVALKARIVEQDEAERGPRQVLNYGHTVGHAVEAAYPGRFVHGEAISIGMRVEADAAVRLGLLPPAGAERQRALLGRLALPVDVPAGSVEPLLDAMRLDKKARGGRIRCSLPEGIGRARLGVDVPEALMREVLQGAQSRS
jgi:3-dehydroquinate synthase